MFCQHCQEWEKRVKDSEEIYKGVIKLKVEKSKKLLKNNWSAYLEIQGVPKKVDMFGMVSKDINMEKELVTFSRDFDAWKEW
jgi:hypothetical protein